MCQKKIVPLLNLTWFNQVNFTPVGQWVGGEQWDINRTENHFKVRATARCSSWSITKGSCPNSILLQYEFRDRARTFRCQEQHFVLQHFYTQADKKSQLSTPLVYHRSIPGWTEQSKIAITSFSYIFHKTNKRWSVCKISVNFFL